MKQTDEHSLESKAQRLASASILFAIGIVAIKYFAYAITGSVALYSDALEGIINIVTAIVALTAIWISAKPADSNHQFGHHKAEFFAAVLEGVLVILAAILILWKAVLALRSDTLLENTTNGMALNAVAAVAMAGWSIFLRKRGEQYRSPALIADAQHLMTDVVTSAGVLAGLALVVLTGWKILDPLLAIAVALHILWMGHGIMLQSMSRLLDQAAPTEIQNRIRHVIAANGEGALEAHDIRTRQAGRALFIELHLVVPGQMTVYEAHDICDRLEEAIEEDIEGSEVVIHVEPDNKAKPHKPDSVNL